MPGDSNGSTGTSQPTGGLSSGLYDVDVFESRQLCTRRKAAKTVSSKELPYHGEYRGKTDYHRGRRADKADRYGRLQGGIEGAAARWWSHLLWKNRYPAASASDKGAHYWGGCIVNKIKELTK